MEGFLCRVRPWPRNAGSARPGMGAARAGFSVGGVGWGDSAPLVFTSQQ